MQPGTNIRRRVPFIRTAATIAAALIEYVTPQVIYWRKMNHMDMEVVLINKDLGL